MRNIFTILAIFFSFSCTAQFTEKKSELKGYVLDGNNKPIPFANVTAISHGLIKMDYAAQTDINGYFKLSMPTIHIDGFEIIINAPGYDALHDPLLQLEPGKTITKNFKMFAPNRTKDVAAASSAQPSRGLKAQSVDSKTKQSTAQTHNVALVLGTDNYNNWTHLSNPVFDAQTIAASLQNDYGFEVTTLKNPTKSEVIKNLRDLYKRFKDGAYGINSNLVIFIAGHGGYDEFFNGYIVTADAKRASDENFQESCIKHDELRGMIDNIPSQHTLVLLDVCYGGTFDQAISSNRHRGDNDEYAINYNELIERTMSRKSRKYITSGGKEYVPDGRAGHHSPFAYNLIAELTRCYETKRPVTFHSLCTALELTKPEPRAGEFGANNDPGSDFILVPASLLK